MSTNELVPCLCEKCKGVPRKKRTERAHRAAEKKAAGSGSRFSEWYQGRSRKPAAIGESDEESSMTSTDSDADADASERPKKRQRFPVCICSLNPKQILTLKIQESVPTDAQDDVTVTVDFDVVVSKSFVLFPVLQY